MRIFYALFLFALPFSLLAQDVSFTNATMLLPSSTTSDHAIGVADMNGDGLDDIIRMNITEENMNSVEQTVYIAIQETGGSDFSEQVIGVISAPGVSSADTWGLSIADLDGNGRNDLMAGGFYNGVYIFHANADNSSYSTDIQLIEEIYVQGMSAFDIDGDGYTDVFVCDDNDISQILMNDGSGNMSEEPTDLTPDSDEDSDGSGNYGSCFSDIDNNGHADLYIAKCRQGVNESDDPRRINLLFMNDGEGNWTSEGVARNLDIGAQSWCADFGDIDNDGDMDVFVGNHDVFSDIYLNDGTGNFTEISASSGIEDIIDFTPVQSSWGDFNNDGYLDLIVTGVGEHIIAINNGDNTFSGSDDEFGNFPTNSYAMGDLNDDGHLDFYMSANGYGGWGNENFNDRLYLNNGSNNNWLKVHLTGNESNANGIGARISINGSWGTQIRDVKAGESYGIQNSMTQHFGLGSDASIDELVVTWPSGVVDMHTNINANQQLNLTEGQSIGLFEQTALISFDLYPNPAQDIAIVGLDEDMLANGNVQLILSDVAGRVAMSTAMTSTINEINLSDLSPGQYLSHIIRDGKVIAQRELLIQR